MIKKRYILIPLGVLIIGVLVVVGALAYLLISNKSDDHEMVFAATEVGTPVGDKVSKVIGSAGGTLVSPDGRLTLTVPPNALAETVPFSIQPITNKADGGLGIAYRLEPDGAPFATPLQLTVHYDDHDLDGTIPEALAIAYQDKKGAWHAQDPAKLDQGSRTLAFATTHFTDFASLAGIRISPAETTVYVGEDVRIRLVQCKEQGLWDKLWSRPVDCSSSAPQGKDSWVLKGAGRLEFEYVSGVNYLAPAKKPNPNIAYVDLNILFSLRNPTTGETFKEPKTFRTKITILDAGYKASGESHDEEYTGIICDVEKPFSVHGAGLASFDMKFNPNGPASGTVDYATTYMAGPVPVNEKSSGTYTLTNISEDGFDVLVSLGGKANAHGRTFSGTGNITIHFTPLKKEEAACGK